jgi:hypothetical protein
VTQQGRRPPPPPPPPRRHTGDSGEPTSGRGGRSTGRSPGPGRVTSAAARAGAAGRAAGRLAATGGRGTARVLGRGTQAGVRRFQQFAAADGADRSGLARLTEMHLVDIAADAALTVSLAGTVFALPADEARGKVAIFLALTMAPFVLLAPLIGPLVDRFSHGRRWAIGTHARPARLPQLGARGRSRRRLALALPRGPRCPHGDEGVCRDPRRRPTPGCCRTAYPWSRRTPASISPPSWACSSAAAWRADWPRSGRSGRCERPSSSMSPGPCWRSACPPMSTRPSAKSTSAAGVTPRRPDACGPCRCRCATFFG